MYEHGLVEFVGVNGGVALKVYVLRRSSSGVCCFSCILFPGDELGWAGCVCVNATRGTLISFLARNSNR